MSLPHAVPDVKRAPRRAGAFTTSTRCLPGNWTQAFSSYGGNAGTFTFGFSNIMKPTVGPGPSTARSTTTAASGSPPSPTARATRSSSASVPRGACTSSTQTTASRIPSGTSGATSIPLSPRSIRSTSGPANNAGTHRFSGYTYYATTSSGQLSSRRCELRVLRRIGQVYQELDQLLDLQYRERRQLRRLPCPTIRPSRPHGHRLLTRGLATIW